ncbi:hypothetical protein HYY72_05535 [Candidatus Woesearchaeota archaeon]|nr:hypothetical protein [Candidatus Woesearchaeota archaeon]
MDSQLAQKVSQLAKSLKASGIAPDSQDAFKMALELLKEKEHGAAINENAPPNGKESDKKVFLGKDSIGAEFKGKSLKELLMEK